jgi:hypothetical protein
MDKEEKKAADEKIDHNENIETNNTENTSASKKLMILYVLDVLKKYSDENHKLTQNEIIGYIKQDYDMDCERKAISRHIKALIDHGYNIETYENNGEGYFMKDDDFSSDDVFMLWEGIMASKYINREEASHLIKNLNKYIGDQFRLGQSYYGGIINKYTYPETFMYGNLKFILTEMAVNKTLEPISEEPVVVSPYAVLNVDNEYYLAACVEYEHTISCYRIGLISDLEHLEFLCDDIKEVTGYSKGFDPKKFTADFIDGYGGEVTDFKVIIQKDQIEQAIETFGEEFKIDHIEEDTLMLDITCNFDKMYRWAVKTASFTEIVEPAAMLFKLKEFFDIQCWKYR